MRGKSNGNAAMDNTWYTSSLREPKYTRPYVELTQSNHTLEFNVGTLRIPS